MDWLQPHVKQIWRKTCSVGNVQCRIPKISGGGLIETHRFVVRGCFSNTNRRVAQFQIRQADRPLCYGQVLSAPAAARHIRACKWMTKRAAETCFIPGSWSREISRCSIAARGSQYVSEVEQTGLKWTRCIKGQNITGLMCTRGWPVSVGEGSTNSLSSGWENVCTGIEILMSNPWMEI